MTLSLIISHIMIQDFVLDWEHELPETDLSLSDSHSVLADLSIVMGSTLQIIPAGVT